MLDDRSHSTRTVGGVVVDHEDLGVPGPDEAADRSDLDRQESR
jgi:hypothetical protein